MEFIIAGIIFLVLAAPIFVFQLFIMYNVELSLLIFSMIIGFIVTLVILVVDKIKKKDTSAKFRHVAMGLFVVYLLFLISITLIFRNKINVEYSRIELIPFHDIVDIIKNKSYFELFEKVYNILMFVPYSFLLGCILQKRKSLAVIIGLATTLSIEIIQFLTERGVCDINDIIFNFVGTLIGYGLYKLFINICQRIVERKNKNVIKP